MTYVLIVLLACVAALSSAQTLPTPTPEQLHYMDSELTMFIHFSVCTFNDGCDGGQQNCGYDGQNQPYPASTFNPLDLDTDQWAQTAVDMGANKCKFVLH